MSRWQYQYQRIADVLTQRVEQLTPDPHWHHERYVRPDGYCPICAFVAAAPPPETWTAEQTAKLRRLFNQPVLSKGKS
jgi:hypothetical protein